MITSADNKLIKFARSLKHKKYREAHNQFLAEGLRAVLDIIKYDYQTIRHVFVTERQKDIFFQSIDLLDSKKTKLEFIKNCLNIVSDSLMKNISDTSSPQEILVIADKKQPSQKLGEYCIYLDRIQDPGNLGTIIRTAAAAGYSVILDGCTDLFAPKVVRSSMSAIINIDYSFANKDTLHTLKQQGYLLLAADSSGKNLFEFTARHKVCAIIGNEANGISKELLNLCHDLIGIPMQNVESLNAAISAAIIMYQLRFG